MWSDAIDLRDFYRTALGRAARRVIRGHVRTIWPDARRANLLGLGYATPYLAPFRGEAERAIAVMPAPQGALRWPARGPNLAALAGEDELPLPDRSIDRVLLAHALECSERLRPMLREVWRVMADDARLLAVVPNRRGIWARFDRTPFGHGRPFTPSQIERLLRDHMFAPASVAYGLFLPPSGRRMAVAAAPAWERLGQHWLPRFGGVLLIEATKRIHAGAAEAVAARRPRAYAAPPRSAL